MKTKKILLIAWAIIFFPLLGMAQYNPTNPNVRAHSKIQNERSYETWEKNQPKVRIKAVKAAVDQSKEVRRKRSKSRKLVARENNLRKKIVKPNQQ